MREDLVSERAWQWRIAIPTERFRAPIEAFWRGLGYEVRWEGEELRGERDLDGQRREFAVRVRSVGSGASEVRCRLSFVGPPASLRPREVYQPSELVTLFGQALARGFGTPALET